jgi:hypothetical protein
VTMEETDDVTVTVVSVVAHVDQAPPDGPFASTDGANSAAALRPEVTRMVFYWTDSCRKARTRFRGRTFALGSDARTISCWNDRVSCTTTLPVKLLCFRTVSRS